MNDSNMESSKGIEYVRCNRCGADDVRKHFRVPVRDDQLGEFVLDFWDIVQCKKCGLIYTNPRADSEALAAYYEFENAADYQFIQDWFIENADLQRPTWQRYLKAMSCHGDPGRLLDVGCGAGSFLVEAQRNGFEVVGQEVSPFFIDYCRREHGLTIFDDEIEDLDLVAGTFDFVTAFDVIEHHPNPRLLLREMHRLLRPGGIIVISTHDIGNWFARLYGSQWRFIDPIAHLTYFTRNSLTSMMKSSGFRILHKGGMHTIDGSTAAETKNRILQFFRVIVLRALVIWLYKPISERIPAFTRWQIKIGDGVLNHRKLLTRAGTQIIMDDEMVFLAAAD